jgi:hypothetical protein
MSALDRILDLLTPPYSVGKDSVLAGVLNVVALELDAAGEDVDRIRLSHWVETAYRGVDLEKIGALFSIPRFPGEVLSLYRERLLARIVAGRDGAVGPDEIIGFASTYLAKAGKVLDARLSSGTPQLVENPHVRRVSVELAMRNGRVSHLFRWRDINRGLDDALPSISIGGVAGRLTASPVLVNLTTGEVIGYIGQLKLGQRLQISPSGDGTARAVATLDDNDVTGSLFSASNYIMGRVIRPGDLTTPPRVTRLVRGANDWAFFLLGRYGVRGLDSFGFGMPDDDMQEGVFDESGFDSSLFPAGTKAQLTLRWEETEPASFIVDVPRRITIESVDAEASANVAVESGLRDSIASLHAAGVKALVNFSSFTEHQRQRDRGRLLGVKLDPERASAGRNDTVGKSGHFGQPTFGGTRFE